MPMPAGQYYIGDLCYVMNAPGEWDKFCDITIDGRNCLDGEFELNGRRFATYGTAYGDGCYQSNVSSKELGVDAGLIGCILVSDIKDFPGADKCGGIIVDFPEEFETGEDDGTITFGHVSIPTSFNMDDDAEDYNPDDDDFDAGHQVGTNNMTQSLEDQLTANRAELVVRNVITHLRELVLSEVKHIIPANYDEQVMVIGQRLIPDELVIAMVTNTKMLSYDTLLCLAATTDPKVMFKDEYCVQFIRDFIMSHSADCYLLWKTIALLGTTAWNGPALNV